MKMNKKRMKIPFNKPYLTGNEMKYITDALARNRISGDGYYSKIVHSFFEQKFDIEKALLTTSCTHALEMAAMLIDLKPGDEVILPSYTFVSTVNAVMLRGAKPVFAEIDPVYLNIDTKDVLQKVTERTKAIFVVHYAGVSCDMNKIMDIAHEHNLFVVEDAAQAMNAKFGDRYLGTIGHIGCFSFHETKNYQCGEGGAIFINVPDKHIIERAEVIREKGTDRSKFFRGEVDKYTWVDVGSSYLPSDMLAAFLYAQMERLDEINDLRARIYERYRECLIPYVQQGLLRIPEIPPEQTGNHHMFYIILNSEEERNWIMEGLKNRGVGAVFHYIPLHLSPMGEKLGYTKGDLPVTERLSSCLLRLPMYAGMTIEEQEYVLESLFVLTEVMDQVVVSKL